MRSRLLFVLLTLLPCVACDQATKALAVEHLQGVGSVPIVDGFVRLVYAENPGAFLGLGRALPDTARAVVFGAGVAAMLAFAAFLLVRKQALPAATAVGLALILAGGIGNLVDRVARPGGRVVDFMQIGVGPVRTGIFNVADVYIMAGAGLIALAGMKRRRALPEPTEGTTQNG
jgi:signal peptidase II